MCGLWARLDGFDLPGKSGPNLSGVLAGYKNLATSIFPVFPSRFLPLDACPSDVTAQPFFDPACIEFSAIIGGSEPSVESRKPNPAFEAPKEY